MRTLHQAGRETRAKYLTPYLASKYKVDVEGLPGKPLLDPAVQGLTMVQVGGMPKEVALTANDAHGRDYAYITT